ncbi:hypothetical protein OAS39_11215, partial [Pirellulales bacterium]|nr:hypothetical protein [Pirellulales bacterium]
SMSMKITGVLAAVTVTCLLIRCETAVAKRQQFESPAGEASKALQVLEAALAVPAESEESAEALTTAVQDALKLLPEQSPAAEVLSNAVASWTAPLRPMTARLRPLVA